MSETLNMFADIWFQSLVRATWQGGMVILVVLAMEALWTSMPPTLRSWLWRLVFLKLAVSLLMPVAIPLPVLPATTSASAATGTKTMTTMDSVTLSDQSIRVSPTAGSTSSVVVSPRSEAPVAWGMTCLALGWLIGAILIATLHEIDRRYFWKQLQASRLAGDPWVEQVVRTVSRLMGSRSVPQVRVQGDLPSPCVFGSRPLAIVFPTAWFEQCSADQLKLAVAHEIGHVKRGDLAWNRLVAVCQMLFFFNPLVWWATRRYLAAQELACDELALRTVSGSPARYARLLLHFVEQPTAPQFAGAVAMTGATVTLRERIEAMNRWSNSRQPWSWSTIVAALAVVLVSVPFTLAEQKPIRSSSEPEPVEQKVEKKKSSSVSKKASASASASSSASGFGMADGLGLGFGGGDANGGGSGNQRGNGMGGARGAGLSRSQSKSSSSVKASVSVSTDPDEEEAEKPQSSSEKQPIKSSSEMKPKKSTSSSSRMSQSMNSTNTGDGDKWTRTTEASDVDRDIKIVESNDEIRVSITTDGSTKTTTAKDADQLQEKYPDVYAVYKKYARPAAKSSSSSESGEDAVKTFSSENDAKSLMKKHLKEMREKEGAGNELLEKMLRDVEKQLDDE